MNRSEPGAAFQWSGGDLVALDVEEIGPGLLRTPLLSASGCARLLAAIESRRRGAACVQDGPNTMHEHGLALGRVGLDGAVDGLLGAPVRALLGQHFAGFGGDSIDGHHSYLVEYASGLDEELGFHVDDSEVTLNVCLGEDFSGAELVMLGRRCDAHRQSPIEPAETIEIEHRPGWAILHAGRHRHRVDPIRRGVRRNLIAWLRSGAYRERTREGVPCGSWCGATTPS